MPAVGAGLGCLDPRLHLNVGEFVSNREPAGNVLIQDDFRSWKWKHRELQASCLIAFLIGTIKKNALERECLI